MNVRSYAIVSAGIFALIAFIQLLRLIFQWQVSINDHVVPMWLSVVVILVAGLLSAWGFRVVQQIHKYLT